MLGFLISFALLGVIMLWCMTLALAWVFGRYEMPFARPAAFLAAFMPATAFVAWFDLSSQGSEVMDTGGASAAVSAGILGMYAALGLGALFLLITAVIARMT